MKVLVLCTVFISVLSLVLGEVNITKINMSNQSKIIYDISPKFLIRNKALKAIAHNITLELKANGSAPLVGGKDYKISNSPTGILLHLLENRKWADLTSNRILPVPLILSAIFYTDLNSTGNTSTMDMNMKGMNLLSKPVVVAKVLALPYVYPNQYLEHFIINTHNKSELRVNGTGLIGAKRVDLYFDGPGGKRKVYDDVSQYPLTQNFVVLRLRPGCQWLNGTESSLNILGVDTGGGQVQVSGASRDSATAPSTYDDDDDYWIFNDRRFVDWIPIRERNIVPAYDPYESPAGLLFVLEWFMYAGFALLSAFVLFLFYRWYDNSGLFRLRGQQPLHLHPSSLRHMRGRGQQPQGQSRVEAI